MWMSLVEMQSCLARLYVSEAYRAHFRRDPDEALAGYDLAVEEAAAVRALDQKMLDIFAATLVTKRRRRVQRAYASSFAWNGAAMDAAFRRFVELHGSWPQPTVHHESLAFGRFAEQTLSDRERFPPAAAELVRFERTSYDATFLQPVPHADKAVEPGAATPNDCFALVDGILVEDFGYDVVALDAVLRENGTAPEPEPLPATIVFRPGRGAGEQRMLRLNTATALVLRQCDGRTTARDVTVRIERELGTSDLGAAVLDTLQRLQALRIVTVRPVRPGRLST
jgi:hypothetical protein